MSDQANTNRGYHGGRAFLRGSLQSRGDAQVRREESITTSPPKLRSPAPSQRNQHTRPPSAPPDPPPQPPPPTPPLPPSPPVCIISPPQPAYGYAPPPPPSPAPPASPYPARSYSPPIAPSHNPHAIVSATTTTRSVRVPLSEPGASPAPLFSQPARAGLEEAGFARALLRPGGFASGGGWYCYAREGENAEGGEGEGGGVGGGVV